MNTQQQSPAELICKINLNFSIKADIPAGESVYITGNLPELGNWNPVGRKLDLRNDGTCSLEVPARKGSIIEYKITRGSWKTQGIYDTQIVPPDNIVIKASKNQEAHIDIIDWLDQRNIDSDPVIGRLIDSEIFPCHGLAHKRPIQIWLPDSYDESGKPCAVIYMHDGQNLFDPAQAFAGVDWKVDETVTRLVNNGEIRQCIVVGIPNSPERMKELNLYTPEGKAYAEFIVNEVKPWVEKNFNASQQPSDNALIGASMGGLISFQMLYAYDKSFSLAGCLSTSFQKTNGQIFNQFARNSFKPLEAKLYLDAGEFEPPIARAYFDMMKLLKENGFIEGHNLMGYYEEQATHCEARWAGRLPLALKFLLAEKII
ncbi:MAG: hypothetical protein CVV42_05345 [Candidatus Riflebacteria bacterium HGW-Riflebacteria-2]|jgi:predicted alpha/beta superfamily hydrolase|nr:MAG: hypothetical protein CVV42_05345 [Candidatus Riflebacteria bacterium HGW-Riflebacteria-2]